MWRGMKNFIFKWGGGGGGGGGKIEGGITIVFSVFTFLTEASFSYETSHTLLEFS